MRTIKFHYILNVIIPILAAAIAVGSFLYVYPIIQTVLMDASIQWGINLVSLGNAMRAIVVSVFIGFTIGNTVMAYSNYRLQKSLIEATEIGSKQLNEARRTLEELLKALRPGRRA